MPWRTWLLLVLPFGVFVSTLISTGAYIQEFLYLVLERGAPTIEEAARQSQASDLPSLGTWLTLSLYPQFLVTGIVVAAIALRHPAPREVALTAAIWTMLLLTLLDFVFRIQNDRLIWDEFAKDVVANLFGGMFVGLLTSCSAWLYESIYDLGGSANHPLLAWGCVVALAVVLSSIVYYVLFFFFQATLVRIGVVSEPPISGYYSSESIDFAAPRPATTPSQDADGFHLLTKDGVGGSLEIQAAGGRLHSQWQSLLADGSHKVEVRLFADCWSLAEAQKARKAPPFATLSRAKTSSMRFEAGQSYLQTSDDRNASHRFTFNNPTMFWISKPDAQSGTRITHFLVHNDVLRSQLSKGSSIYLWAPLHSVRNGSSIPSDRTLELTINGRKQAIVFTRAKGLPASRKLRCRSIHPTSVMNGRVSASQEMILAGAMLTASPADVPSEIYRQYKARHIVANANGWGSIDRVRMNTEIEEGLGSTGFFAVLRGIKKIQLDEVDRPVREDTSVVTFGTFRGSYAAGSQLRMRGIARLLWIDGERSNPSRWERLDTEWKIAVLGAIGTALILLSKLLSPAVRRLATNEPYVFP